MVSEVWASTLGRWGGGQAGCPGVGMVACHTQIGADPAMPQENETKNSPVHVRTLCVQASRFASGPAAGWTGWGV